MSMVNFKKGLYSGYRALTTKDVDTLYFCTDTQQIFLGDTEYTRPILSGAGAPSTSTAPASPKDIFYFDTTNKDLYVSLGGAEWVLVVDGAVHEALQDAIDTVSDGLADHIADKENPHSVTAAQVGAYTKEETADLINEMQTQAGAHSHTNKNELDKIADGDVAKWNNEIGAKEAAQGALSHAEGVEGALHDHMDDSDVHITAQERESWNSNQVNVIEEIKVNGESQAVTDKSVNITIPKNLTDFVNDAGYLTANDITGKADKSVVDTLVGEDTGKSARTIANEELAKQLIPESAAESLNTLSEIAAWIQSHPEDASAMNEAITALQKQLKDLGVDEGAVKKYIDDAVAGVDTGVMSVTSGTANGTILVDNEEVKVAGLKDLAFLSVGKGLLKDVSSGDFTLRHAKFTESEQTIAFGTSIQPEQAPSYGGTFQIPKVNVSEYGHVLSCEKTTVQLPTLEWGTF